MRALLCDQRILIGSSPLATQLNVTASFRFDETFVMTCSKRAGSLTEFNINEIWCEFSQIFVTINDINRWAYFNQTYRWHWCRWSFLALCRFRYSPGTCSNLHRPQWQSRPVASCSAASSIWTPWWSYLWRMYSIIGNNQLQCFSLVIIDSTMIPWDFNHVTLGSG